MANFNSTYENLSKQILTAAFSTPGLDCHLKRPDFRAESPVVCEKPLGLPSSRMVMFVGASIDRVPYGSVPDEGPMDVLSEAEAVLDLAERIQTTLGGPLYIDFPPDSPEEGGFKHIQWAGNVKRQSGAIEILIVTGLLRLTRGTSQSGGSPVW